MRTRRVGRLAAAFVVLAGIAAGTGAVAGAQEGTELIVREVDGTDLSAVQITFLYGGDRDDLASLTVRENGRQVETSAPAPLQEGSEQGVVLLVDVSGSMSENAAIERAREAAAAYISDRGPSERIAVVTFGSTVEVLQEFTANAEQLADAVADIDLSDADGTRLYDGLATAAGLYEDTTLQPNVLLLSDGDDSASDLDRGGALSALAHVDAAVFSVALESSEFEPDELSDISARTGGQALTTDDAGELTELFAEMHTKLAQQYVVTYESQLEAGQRAAELQVARAPSPSSRRARSHRVPTASGRPTSPSRRVPRSCGAAPASTSVSSSC
jgi:VWFA-related protein